MAKFVAKDYQITINGTDVSSYCAACTMDVTLDEVETTSFGKTYRQRVSGLGDTSVTLDFHQDFGAGGIDALIQPLLGSNATVVVKPTSGSVSSTNPSYTGVYLVSQYQPFASSVGDLATLSVTWPGANGSGVTRGTV